MKNDTIKTRLLIIFLFSGFLSITAFIISFNFIQDYENDIWNINKGIDLSHNFLLKDVKVTRDFFSNETINSRYFQTGESYYLNEHYLSCSKFYNLIAELNIMQQKKRFGLEKSYNELLNEFNLYNKTIDEIITKINLRGFKDNGFEGKMRYFAHKLEEISHEIGKVEILTLRKHEKDFIIRQDLTYQVELHKKASELKQIVKKNKLSVSAKQYYISLIDGYESNFDSLVYLDKSIGLKKQEGLKKVIDMQVNKIDHLLTTIYSSSLEKGQEKLSDVKKYFILVWILLVVAGIIGSFWISARITYSISFLKERITEFIESDFTKRTATSLKESDYEIDILTNHFTVLEQHIENQMKTLKSQNKELKMFIYRASHDLRGPFTSIKGAVNYAMSQISDKKTLEILTKINTVTDNFNDIVEELAMVSDIKQDNLQIKEIDAFEITKRCIQGFNSMPNFGKIIFKTEVTINNRFYSDERFLKIILRNLIENSIKYMNKGAVSSYVKILFTETNDKLIKITVSDNGIGIKQEFQNNIFDMFFRANDSIKGTGLGLYIVQNVLEKLSGAIKVKSEEGIGTSFDIFLPNTFKNMNNSQRIIDKKKSAVAEENFVLDYL